MDVQTLAPTSAQSLPGDPSNNAPPLQGAIQPVVAQSDPTPGALAAAPDASQSQPGGQSPKAHLPQEVAKIFSGGSASHISISFQVAHYPNEIVTVFKDSATGEVVSQVPSEIMVKIAEFFDQHAGVVLDKSA